MPQNRERVRIRVGNINEFGNREYIAEHPDFGQASFFVNQETDMSTAAQIVAGGVNSQARMSGSVVGTDAQGFFRQPQNVGVPDPRSTSGYVPVPAPGQPRPPEIAPVNPLTDFVLPGGGGDPFQGSALGQGENVWSVLRRRSPFRTREQVFPSPGQVRAQMEIGVGALKSIPNRALDLYDILRGRTGRDSGQRSRLIQPANPAQEAGLEGERIAEYFVAPAVLKGLGAGRLLSKLPGEVGRLFSEWAFAKPINEAILEGASTAIVTASQSGLDTTAAGIDGAFDAALTVSFGGLGTLLSKGGRRAMATAIGAGYTDVKRGFNVDNVFRYKLDGGTLNDVFKNADAAIVSRANELNDILMRSSGIPIAPTKAGDAVSDFMPLHSNVDLDQLLQEAFDNVGKEGLGMAAQQARLTQAREFWQRAIDSARPRSGRTGRLVTVLETNNLKQNVGTFAEFAANSPDIDTNSMELFSREFYRLLEAKVFDAANDVGGASGESIRRLNKELSEIIPIRDAIVRRLPQEEKKRLFEFAELIVLSGGLQATLSGADILAAGGGISGMILAVRAARSARGAAALNFLGPGVSALGRGLGRGGVAAGVPRNLAETYGQYREGPQ